MRKIIMVAISLIAAILCIKVSALGQNQMKADSLKLILSQDDTLSLNLRLALINKIAILSTFPDGKLAYADTLFHLASKENLPIYAINALRHQGVAYRLKGNLKQSLEKLFLSAQMAVDNREYLLQSKVYLEIANTYTSNNEFKNALSYEKRAINIIREHGKKTQLAINLLNIGFSYYTLNELDSALLNYNEAEPIFEKNSMINGQAYAIGNRALVYWKQGNYANAEKDLLKAIEMLQPIGDKYGMADYHNQIGRLYLEQNNTEKAIEHIQKALSMAKDLGLKEQIRDAVLLLSTLHTTKRDYQKGLEYQTLYIAYKDSIENTEKSKNIADMRTAFEVSLKEKEIDLLEKNQKLNKTYIIIGAILLILSVMVLLYFRQRFLTTQLVSINDRKQHNEKINDLLSAHETKALEAMVQGRDNERKRLAQELHNHFGSLLATIKVNINGIEEDVIPNHHTLTTLVDQACSDIRNMSHSLNMGISENFGLVPALKELTTHLRKSGELEVEFAASMPQGLMNSEGEILVYRIIQELVSNVLKHAEASKLSILLTCFEDDDLVNIIVHDNGKGFEMKDIKSDTDCLGLKSLKKMVTNLQGDIKFDSSTIGGTTVNIDLPIAIQA